jgi:hypothetical protein
MSSFLCQPPPRDAYNLSKVDALSELFVAWDDAITDAEDKVARLERDREERKRLGYE